jgi:hypothetical protein
MCEVAIYIHTYIVSTTALSCTKHSITQVHEGAGMYCGDVLVSLTDALETLRKCCEEFAVMNV